MNDLEHRGTMVSEYRSIGAFGGQISRYTDNPVLRSADIPDLFGYHRVVNRLRDNLAILDCK